MVGFYGVAGDQVGATLDIRTLLRICIQIKGGRSNRKSYNKFNIY